MVGRGEKFSRPKKTEAEEVLEVEHSSYAVKGGILAGEMDLKYLPQWFYAELRSREGW